MIRQIPMYENNGNPKLSYNSATNCYEQSYITITLDAPLNSIDEVKNYIIFWKLNKTVKACDKFKEAIDDIALSKQLLIKTDTQKKHIETMFCQLPFQYRPQYECTIKELKSYLLKSQMMSGQFIHNNKDELMLFVNETKNNLTSIMKEKRTVANKTYYEKKKETLGNENEVLPSNKNKRAVANKQYYEKQKQKHGLETRLLLTEEEKKQRRRDVNKQYYKTNH